MNFTTNNLGTYLIQQVLRKRRPSRSLVGLLKKLLLLSTLVALLYPYPALAEVPTDKAAHMGVGFALQTFGYGFSKKALRLTPAESLLFTTIAVFTVGLAKEYTDRQIDMGDVGANLLGQIGATATILMFDF